MKSLVTLCVPTYNAEKTLGATLNSLLSQTHENIKIKIFDNQSQDATLTIAQEYARRDSRVEVHVNQENLGAEGNFTVCLQNGTGDYTGIFHSDDVYEPLMIEKQVNALEADPSLGAVSTQAYNIDVHGRRRRERLLPNEISWQEPRGLAKFSQRELFELILKYGNFVVCPSVLARTSIYKNEISVWNFEHFKTAADLDVWLRLAKEHKFGVLREPLMGYRLSNASLSFRMKKQRTEKHDLFYVLDHYIKEIFPEGLPEECKRYYEFLRFKDAALVTFNRLKCGIETDTLPIFSNPPALRDIVPVGLQSRFHLKILCAASLIWGFATVMAPAYRLKQLIRRL